MEGGGLKPSEQAERTCAQLKRLSYVRRCSPDHKLSPGEHKLSESFSAPSGFLQAKGKDKTEAGFTFECRTCKSLEMEAMKEAAEAVEKTSNKQANRACPVIPGKRGLMSGRLSDYWAQEMIGSDLLREELKKTNPPVRENWIAVFDSHKEDHNIAVKNLISDDGPHAVLPKLEGRIPFLNTGADSQNVQTIEDYKEGKGYKPALSLYETSYPGDYLLGLKKNPLITSTIP